jgi:hypothetical protein
MEVLFHFVFELFKIAVLASVYATVVRFIIIKIARKKPSNLSSKISTHKTALWYLFGSIISVMLFAYMFSYWGDHGLGDFARIPIGHGKSIEQVNGGMTFIRPPGYEYEVLCIDDYVLSNDFLFAKTAKYYMRGNTGGIAIWDLKKNRISFLDAVKNIDTFYHNHHIKNQLKFQDFQSHYANYWNGWRFWLLP